MKYVKNIGYLTHTWDGSPYTLITLDYPSICKLHHSEVAPNG